MNINYYNYFIISIINHASVLIIFHNKKTYKNNQAKIFAIINLFILLYYIMNYAK